MTLPRRIALRWRTAIVSGALAACGAVGIWAQDAGQPTFRSDVEVVEIDAAVVDAQGTPVTGLRAEDFEIIENGKAGDRLVCRRRPADRRVRPAALRDAAD